VAALLIAPLVAGAIAALADWFVLKRVDYDPEATIVATIGLLYILQQSALMIYGPEARPVEPPSTAELHCPGLSGAKTGLRCFTPGGLARRPTSCL